MKKVYVLTQKAMGTPAQGVLLCFLSTLSVAASLLIAPILPKIVAAFAPDPNAQLKVILALTLPALVVAVTAPLAGGMVDRLGRKGLLIASLILYVFCGLAPFLLNDLNLIIASRIGVGVAEAGVMTASTTLIGDYFKGKDREHWLVVQTSIASVSAVVLMAAGGILGDHGWRWPFLVYALPLVVIPLVIGLVREPAHSEHEDVATTFPWLKVLPLYVIGLAAAALFFVVPIQTPFLLTGRGMGSPQLIGLTSAAGGIAVPIGGFLFKRLSKLGLPGILALAFALIAVGLALFAGNGDYSISLAGIVVTSLGCGMTLPAILTAIMSRLSFAQRGFGTGGWQTGFFLGNFLSPLIVLGLTAHLRNLDEAIQALSAFAAVGFLLSGMSFVFLSIKSRQG